jgi:hypothetical protein
MVIVNEEELIARYIDILSSKRNMYQRKLNEIEKRKHMKAIFTKYPESPMRCLVELADSELVQILSDFLDIKSDTNDIKIKKYWMSESSNNKALQTTHQYKSVKKIFENLLDSVQSYLDYSKDFKFKKESITEELELVTKLKDKLVSNEPIIDFSKYYSVLVSSDTITCDDLYKYISAISVNNLNVISNIETKEIDVEIDKDITEDLITGLESILIEKQKEARDNDDINRKMSSISNLVNKIKDNYDELINVYPDDIKKTMYSLWEESDIEYYIDRLALPVTIIKGKSKGLELELGDEETNIINKFIDLLETKYNDLKSKEELEYNEELINEDENIYYINQILNKLRSSSKNLLEYNDFITIVNIMKKQNKSYEEIIDIINNLNAINLKKCSKEIIDNTSEEEQQEKNKQQNRSLRQSIKKIETLFTKYGFNYSSFPEKLIEELVKNAKLDHIEEMLEYIDSTNELSFLKDYTLPIGSSELEKGIQEIKCSQLCFILAYSNIEILDNFLAISKKDKIDLYDIFSIPKVFASKNNEDLSGTYENFIINEKYIKNEYPKMLHELVSRCPFVLGTDSYLFKKNIELTEKYGMSIEKDKAGSLPAPIALATEDFEYVMDRYIEVQDYDYIECFRSQLETNASVALRIKYMQKKGLDFKKKGYVDLSKQFNSEIENYLGDLSIDNIGLAKKDDSIKLLDSINEEKDKNKLKIQYIFNNIYISRVKVLKYYGTLLLNNYEDKKEALLYSITKDSYLTEEEFNYLKELVYKGDEN